MTTVRLFAQLKLRLLAGNLRGDVQRKLGFIFTLVMAVVVAVGGFLLLALIRFAPPDVAASLAVLVFFFLFAGWILAPLLAFGLDDTLDPARLSLFPLRTGTLAVGMFTASATGPWPLASLVVTAGVLAGLASGVGGVLLGIVAVLLQFALCLVTSRLVTTALSGALRSRRGRDALAVAAILVVLLAQLPNLLFNGGRGDPGAMLRASAGLLRWTPPGLAAHAMADGGLTGLAELVVLAVVVLVLGGLWIKALNRALVTPDASTQAASVRKETGLVDRFLPDGPLAAVVTKELKYIRREPRYRVNWFSAVLGTIVLAFSLTNSANGPPGGWVPLVLTTISGLMIALQSGNIFGVDGRSLWMNAVATGSERGLSTDLAGRHLAGASIATPLMLLIAVGAGLYTGHPEMIAPGLLAGWGALGVGYGVGSIISVILPYTMPERMNAFSSAAPGQGGQAFAGSMVTMVAVGVLSLPFVLPAVLGLTWVCVLAPFYGLLAEVLGRRLGARIGFARMPELLIAVSRPT